MILSHPQDEDVAFSAFVNLMEHWKLKDWYKNDLEGLRMETFVVFPVMLEKNMNKVKLRLVRHTEIVVCICILTIFSTIFLDLSLQFIRFLSNESNSTHFLPPTTYLTCQEKLNVHPSLYLTPWCLELFFGAVPFELMMRCWDLFLLSGPMAFYSISLSLIKLNSGTKPLPPL